MGQPTEFRPGSARASIAARLAALDRPPDFLTEDAVAALLAHAGGSLPRLRAALASTLFLSATEDAPRADHTHVERAVAALPPLGPGTARRAGVHSVWLLAGAAVVALIVGVPIALWRTEPGAAAAPGAATTAPAQLAPQSQVYALQQPAAVLVVQTPPTALAHLPALRPGRTLTAQTAGAMTVPPPRAPPAIVLRYQPADRWAADKLAAASAYLRRAGFTRIYAFPLRGHATPIGVRYFFPEDQDAARRVLAVAAGPLGERPLMQRRTAMLLVRQPASQHAHPPGTLELILP
jgi:hypothetical protein